MACCAPERASCSVLVQYRLRSEVTAYILFPFDLQHELKEREKGKKEIQWDTFEFSFTGASFKTNSGLTLLYAVTLVYFCTYFV